MAKRKTVKQAYYMANKKNKDQPNKGNSDKSRPKFRELFNRLKKVHDEPGEDEYEFEEILDEIWDVLEGDLTVNAQDDYLELSEYFENLELKSTVDMTTMADLHYSFGNTEKALEYYKRSLTVVKLESGCLSGCCPWIWRYFTYFCEVPKNYEEALEEINAYMRASSQNKVGKKGQFWIITLFFKAKVLLDLGQFEEALRLSRKSLKAIMKGKATLLPIPVVLFQIGQCHQAMKNYQLAIQVYDNAIAKSEDDMDNYKIALAQWGALFNRGVCYFETKDFSKALARLEGFVGLLEHERRSFYDRTLNKYHFQASQLMEKIKNETGMASKFFFTYKLSKADFIKYQEAETNGYEAYRHSKNEDHDEAYKLFMKAITAMTKLLKGKFELADHGFLHLGAMNSAVHLKKYYEAIKLGEQSICVINLQSVKELAEDNEYFDTTVYKEIPSSFQQLATAYRQIGYFSEALHCYKRSFLAHDRQNLGNKKIMTCLIHNAGRMYYNIGNYQKATDCFEKTADLLRFMKLEGDMKIFLGHNTLYLSLSYKNLGMYQEAIEVLEEKNFLDEFDDQSIRMNLFIVASICHLRLFNFQSSWNAILEAEKLDQDSCCLFCNTIFIHKFRITLELTEKLNSEFVWETTMKSIIPFTENPEEHVLKLRKIFLKSFDHDDLKVLLVNLRDYFRFCKTTEDCNEVKRLLMPKEDNYLLFINSSQICNFFQAKTKLDQIQSN